MSTRKRARLFPSTITAKALAAVAAGAILLGTGCANTGPKEGVGTLAGAAAGGLLGSQFGSGTGQLAAVGLGVLVGGLVGSEIGRSLDETDRALAARTHQHALESAPTGDSYTWKNPDSGHRGATTPTRTYQNAEGRYCREFTQTVYVGGKAEEGYGTACRQPDGTWQMS